LAAVGAGELTVGEAGEFAKLVEAFLRGLEVAKAAERQEHTDRIFPGLNFGGLAAR
jgi:hypothetical protein